MTATDFLTILITPAGFLLLGAWAYWIATRDARREAKHSRGK